MSKCERCPLAGPCAGEEGKWAGLACKMAEQGAEASARWVAERSGAEAPAPPPVEPPAYPPLMEQAANLAKAAGRFVASGLAVAGKAERERRRSICRACPTGRYDAEAQRCRGCGCYASLKPWSKAEHCPDGHW